MSPRTFPVAEIFGPTIQGEGAEVGQQTHFVRLGGCDYRCSWCDTMYAVDPATVRASERLTALEIYKRLEVLSGRPRWVTISGGNPALHHLGVLVRGLKWKWQVAVETQGSLWRDWLHEVNRLTVSPKSPSSGMATDKHNHQLELFMRSAVKTKNGTVILKIACADDGDLLFAKEIRRRWPDFPMYLSVVTPTSSDDDVVDVVSDRFRWLCEATTDDPDWSNVVVLPQLHVIAWGRMKGV